VAEEKKTSKPTETNSNLDQYNNARHNDNAKAAAANEPITPRINTDNL
jgi:hypothetical protein